MRVCFISHSAGRYGAELALLELLQGLVKLGVRCLVLVPRKGPILSELDRMNIEWRIIHYPKWTSRSFLLRIARTLISLVIAVRMAQILVQWRCDVVYTNTSIVCVGAFAAWLARKPHVWHSHESSRQKPKIESKVGEYWMLHLMHRLSKFIVVISHAVKNDYMRYIGSGKIRLIYQAVTLCEGIERTDALNHDKCFFHCVIVASLNPWKGQSEAISALSEVIHRGINARLLVVGNGKERFLTTLQQQVKDCNLEQYVEFIGYVENPVQFIRIADVVLICSHWEPFGRVTVEAMLAGKPVIATNSGATAELIHDGVTGLLYDPGNYNELANKIQYLYENPEKGLKLGSAARIWAEDRFTQERYAMEVFDLLNEVLKTV
ncbi:MAG: glycosyltransferase family 4 protein [Nitrosomonas sp.]|nr:glycosyltransferase family 4 protein [Nitrosomonas sp.]